MNTLLYLCSIKGTQKQVSHEESPTGADVVAFVVVVASSMLFSGPTTSNFPIITVTSCC